jgi:hypothetical protein
LRWYLFIVCELPTVCPARVLSSQLISQPTLWTQVKYAQVPPPAPGRVSQRFHFFLPNSNIIIVKHNCLILRLNRHINERDVIIWDVLIAIISRNILRKFLGWQSLIRHACQFKLQNVQRIIYQDSSGNKFATVFLAISRYFSGRT